MPWPTDMIQNTVEQNAELLVETFKSKVATKAIKKFVLSGFALRGYSLPNRKKKVLGFQTLSKNAYNLITAKHPEWIHNDMFVKLGGEAYELGLRIEHIIPTEVAYKHILQMVEQDKFDVEYVMAVLAPQFQCALVTKEDDAKLNKAGLRAKMPEGWSFDNCDDMFERYKQTGIELIHLEK